MPEGDAGRAQSDVTGDVSDWKQAAVAVMPGLCVALILRVALAMATRDTPLAMGADRPLYDEVARSLASQQPDPRQLFLSPLYPTLLAALGSGTALTWLQHAAGIVSAGLTALLALRTTARLRVAQGAGLLFALSGPLLFFETQVYPTSLSLFALLVALTLLTSGSTLWALGAGTAFAIAVLLNPSLLPLPVFLSLASSRRSAQPRGPRLIALLLLPLAIALIGNGLRNASLEPGFAPLGSNSGVTLAHGNQPASAGGYAPLPGSDGSKRQQHLDARREAAQRQQLDIDGLRPADVDRFWRAEALRWMAAQPFEATANFVHKALRFAFADRLPLDTSWSSARRDAWPLRLASVAWLALFMPALVFAAWRREVPRLVTLSIAAVALTCVLFFPSERYRLPALALAAIPCAQFLDHTLRRGPLAGGLGALAFALLVGVCALRAPDAPTLRLALSNQADNLEWSGHVEAALRLAREVDDERRDLRSVDRVARVLLGSERNEEARQVIEAALQEGLESAALHNGRGLALLRLERPARAERALQRALRIDERFAAAHFNLGRLEEARRRPRYAAEHYARYTELAPEDASGWFALARARTRSGLEDPDTQAALDKSLERAAPQGAVRARIQSWVGQQYAQRGDDAAARKAFRAALAADPRHAPAARGLADLDRSSANEP